MKLPTGWRIYLFVVGLNGVGLALWYLDRGAVAPISPGGIGQWLTQLGG